MQGRLEKGVYVLNSCIPEIFGHANVAKTFDVELWHARLGHANVQSIEGLFRNNSVIGLERKVRKHTSNCEGCLEGKMTRSTLRTRPEKASAVGEVIHSDLCGPMSFKSLGGSRYYVSFIDEHSGYTVIKPIAKKSDVSLQFRKFLVWFERKFATRIKKLHSDNGGSIKL